MILETPYGIGDIVNVECLDTEELPCLNGNNQIEHKISKHKIIELGIIDEIVISREGIKYKVFVLNDKIQYQKLKIIGLSKSESPTVIQSIEQFQEYAPITLNDTRTNKEYISHAFWDNGKIVLEELGLDNNLLITEEELLENFKYKVDLTKLINPDLLIENGLEYIVVDNKNKESFVTTDDIERFCYLYKVEVKNN